MHDQQPPPTRKILRIPLKLQTNPRKKRNSIPILRLRHANGTKNKISRKKTNLHLTNPKHPSIRHRYNPRQLNPNPHKKTAQKTPQTKQYPRGPTYHRRLNLRK